MTTTDYNWLELWENNEIPFHLSTVNPMLEAFWPQLEIDTNSNILVPLCGKTLDLLQLSKYGHTVTGVELSEIACQDFFAENDLPMNVEKQADFTRYYCENIELYNGDFFKLSASILPKITAVYDRAALIALPDELRQAYVKQLIQYLPLNAKMLLIVYESTDKVEGPPYPLSLQEITKLFAPHFEINEIGRFQKTDFSKHLSDKGYKKMDEVVYFLKKAAVSNNT